MPRSERSDFYRRHGTTRNRPLYVEKPYTGTMLAKRNVRLTIREAAIRRSLIAMLYTKLTTGDTLEYTLEPYSYRYRRLRVGVRKVFFAYKVGPGLLRGKDRGIRMFYLAHIHAVKILHRKYQPRWVVEIG